MNPEESHSHADEFDPNRFSLVLTETPIAHKAPIGASRYLTISQAFTRLPARTFHPTTTEGPQ